MKTLLLIILAMSVHPGTPSPNLPEPPPIQTQPEGIRASVLSVADGAVGIREKTGNNDGKDIDAILAAVGMAGSRAPYCAAFVVWCGDVALGRSSNPYPRSAWSPDMVKGAAWIRGNGPTPRPGDTFGIYFASKGRVGHTGLIRRDLGNTVETTEGNTSGEAVAGSAADREGQGVFRKRRLKSQVYAIRNWIGTKD